MARQYTTDSGPNTTSTIREDFGDEIYIMSPMDTPLHVLLDNRPCYNFRYSWPVDEIAQPTSVSAKLEGDVPVATTRGRDRLFNEVMIDHEAIDVSDSQRVVDEAAVQDEFSYQVTQKGLELLKRADFNLHWSSYVARAGSTAAQTAGMVEWCLRTGFGRQSVSAETVAGSVVPVKYSSTLFEGAETLLTEAQLRDNMLQPSWRNGMQIPASVLMVGARLKQAISDFGTVYTSGSSVVSSAWIAAEKKRKILTIDVFETDYGPLSVVLDRYLDDGSVSLSYTASGASTGSGALVATADETALLIEPQFWKIRSLRPLAYSPLDKTGDFTRGYNVYEMGLQASNPIAGTIGIQLAA